jgi:hypothetical protein
VTLILAALVLAATGLIQTAGGRHGAHLHVVNRPSTIVGACGAVVALALVLVATVEIAVRGTYCSWPQSATTLSGLGLIVSIVPALVAIRQTSRHQQRSIAYWLMVGAAVAAVGFYMWLLSGANHACPGGFVSDILN